MSPARALPRPCLMLVTDRSLATDMAALVRDVATAVESGVDAVIVREKDLPEAQLLELVRRIQQEVSPSTMVLVNATAEIALASGADGVHGSESSPPVAETLRTASSDLLVGLSVHSLDGAVAAAAAGVDYLLLGTVFPSRSHPGGETGGMARVRLISSAIDLPVIGIGGITAANAADVIRAGAAGVAVISAILGQPDVRSAVAGLRAAVDAGFRDAQASRRALVR